MSESINEGGLFVFNIQIQMAVVPSKKLREIHPVIFSSYLKKCVVNVNTVRRC